MKSTGLRVGSGVVFREKLIGHVDRIIFLPRSQVSNQPEPRTSEPVIEVSMQITNMIEGQPWFELIRTDSTARKAVNVDFSRRTVTAYIVITPGTDMGVPGKENQLIPATSK